MNRRQKKKFKKKKCHKRYVEFRSAKIREACKKWLEDQDGKYDSYYVVTSKNCKRIIHIYGLKIKSITPEPMKMKNDLEPITMNFSCIKQQIPEGVENYARSLMNRPDFPLPQLPMQMHDSLFKPEKSQVEQMLEDWIDQTKDPSYGESLCCRSIYCLSEATGIPESELRKHQKIEIPDDVSPVIQSCQNDIMNKFHEKVLTECVKTTGIPYEILCGPDIGKSEDKQAIRFVEGRKL